MEFGLAVIGSVNGKVFSVMGQQHHQISLIGIFSGNDPVNSCRKEFTENMFWSVTECTKIAHRHSLAIFTADEGYRREFRSEDYFYPFSSQKKSRFASVFLRRGNRASWGLKNRAIFWGAVKIAAATAENRAILVHSGR